MDSVYRYVELSFRLTSLDPAIAFYGYVGGFKPDGQATPRAITEAKQLLLMIHPDARSVTLFRVVEVSPDEAYRLHKAIEQGYWIPRVADT